MIINKKYKKVNTKKKETKINLYRSLNKEKIEISIINSRVEQA